MAKIGEIEVVGVSSVLEWNYFNGESIENIGWNFELESGGGGVVVLSDSVAPSYLWHSNSCFGSGDRVCLRDTFSMGDLQRPVSEVLFVPTAGGGIVEFHGAPEPSGLALILCIVAHWWGSRRKAKTR